MSLKLNEKISERGTPESSAKTTVILGGEKDPAFAQDACSE